MIKIKKMSSKFKRYEKHMINHQAKSISESMHSEHYIMFQRYARREIQNLVFLQTEPIYSPRLHNNFLLQSMMNTRLDELIDKLVFMKVNEPSDITSIGHSLIKDLKLIRRPSIMTTREEEGSVPLSKTLNVIHHANDVTPKRFSRIHSIMTVKEKEESFSTSSEKSNTISKEANNLIFIEKQDQERESQPQFDPDFILWTVFGYKNVSLSSKLWRCMFEKEMIFTKYSFQLNDMIMVNNMFWKHQ